MNEIPACVLVGLTATGKKSVGVRVAARMDAEIISLDSVKVYRGMDIGSAKPKKADRETVPFHLLDILEPSESFSVGQFLVLARDAMEAIHARGKRVLFLGGTAFYLNCMVNGLVDGIGGDPVIRRGLLERVQHTGPEPLHDELKEKDPACASKIHPNDTKRIVRALEVIHATGKPFSWLKRHKTRRIIPGPFRIAGLKRPMEEVKQRITRRAQKMIEQGLVEEVRALLDSTGFGQESGKAIGYREIIDHLQGGIGLDEAVQRINTATWRFAKRQMTWYRRFEQIRWFDVSVSGDVEKIAAGVGDYFLGSV